MMYHIFYDLETRFRSLAEVQEWVACLTQLIPEVPRTYMSGEDASIARVCAAPTVEACITAVKATGTFRRCLTDADDDLFDYENDNEVYPIVVCSLEGTFFSPARALVPDVHTTGEVWATSPCRVVSANLVWVGKKSIIYEEDRVTACMYANPAGKDHPWLNGKGHPLICSARGSEPWPEAHVNHGSVLYLDSGLGCHCLVEAVPEQPFNGYCTCYPISGAPSYRSRLDYLREFTGFTAREGYPIFAGDWVQCPDNYMAGGYTIRWDNGWIVQSDNGVSYKLGDIPVKSLELHRGIQYRNVFEDAKIAQQELHTMGIDVPLDFIVMNCDGNPLFSIPRLYELWFEGGSGHATGGAK